MLAPVHALGPGERVCLWTRGCSKRCPGCISPEMQPATGPQVPEELLAQILTETAVKNSCRGLTVSGGDPLEQPEALLRLLRLLRPAFADILVYTGYRMEELRAGAAGEAGIACLELIDVLIDGRYNEARQRHDCALRGSDDQTIWYLDPDKRQSYEDYMRQGRILETFVHGDTAIVVGIQDKAPAPNEREV